MLFSFITYVTLFKNKTNGWPFGIFPSVLSVTSVFVVQNVMLALPFLSFPPAADTHHSHISVESQYTTLSTSPGVPHLRFNRRASEASLASQVSGLADSYTASNIATSESPLCLVPSLLNSHIYMFTLSFPPSKPPR